MFLPAGLLTVILVYIFSVGVIARYITHHDKTFPNVVVAGEKAGGLDKSELTRRLSVALDGQSVQVVYGDEVQTFGSRELGVSVDEHELGRLITRRGLVSFIRPWFMTDEHTLAVRVDETRLAAALDYFKAPDFKPPVNATFIFKDGEFRIADDQSGLGFDVAELAGQLKARLGSELAPQKLVAAKKTLPAAIQTKDIRSLEPRIKAYADKEYQIVSPDKAVTADKADIAAWLVVEKAGENSQIRINKQAVQGYVEKTVQAFRMEPVNKLVHRFASGQPDRVAENGRDGKAVANTDSLVQSLLESLERQTPYKGEVTFKRLASKTDALTINDVGPVFTYEVITWGAVRTGLEDFAAQVAQTLGDSRGWSAAGIRFSRVASGGNFSVVLAEPARVAGASPACDAYYSCRVGRNVIINDDRWRNATPSWNNAGGSLRNYRHMVVNHETGHWLGFGHRHCPAPGAPAPVMQQQSMSLQGCAANPWPTPSEIASY